MNGLALCAGAGGLELGLRLAIGDGGSDDGYRTVCYVERDSYAAATLVARMEDASLEPAPIWDDLTTFNGAAWRGRVDIVTAGFPCQPWSHAGKRAGTDDERWLWPDIARILRDVAPGEVFLENVSGLLSGGLEHVLWDLAKLGFDAEWCVLGAADVGASHRRKRLWILAHTQRDGECGWRGPGDVGGASGARKGQGPERQWDGYAALDRSAAVADGYGYGCERGWQSSQQSKSARRDVASRCSSAAVADAIGFRLDGWAHEPWRGPQERDATSWSSPWPPAPNDVSAWSRVPQSAQPAVCRVADGLAYRMDRLRLTGNGVVPVVAAMAYLHLRARLVNP